MKSIRKNKKKFTWFFKAPNNSKLEEHYYTFKYKSDLMKFLNNNISNVINGFVGLDCDTRQSSGTYRKWFVWINEYEYNKNAPLKIELKQMTFRGEKYVFKPSKISKEDVKYYAFLDKKIKLMCNIKTKKDEDNLVELFYKSGFKDFEPNKEEQEHIDFYITDGIPFSYWCDRCNNLRMKTIIEYFKK